MQLDASAGAMALAGGVAGIGLASLVLPRKARTREATARLALPSVTVLRRLVMGVVAGAFVGWVTGWPVAGLAAVAAVGLLPGLFSGPSQAEVVARLDGIATWTEQLRNSMVVAKGLTEALQNTARVASGPLEEPLRRMAYGLRVGVRPADALRTLGQELADPTADMVIAPLIQAAERDAEQISEALDALAAEARTEASQRREIDASRASARTQMRMVAMGSLGFMALFWLVGRHTPLLAFYSTTAGQGVLVLVALLMAAGIRLMARMVRPQHAERIVLMSEVKRAGSGRSAEPEYRP